MNELTTIAPHQTMSSREIADLTGKRHDNVMRDIRTMLIALHGEGGLLKFEGTYLNSQNKEQPLFNLPKRECLILASGYDVHLRARIIDRLEEAERQIAHAASAALLSPDVRSAIGGIVKGVVHKEVGTLLPAMIQAELVAHRFHIVEGVSALEIAEIAGYTKGNRPRGLIQFITRRVGRYHEDRGVPINRSPHGSGKVRLFNESVARQWLAVGGKAEIAAYVAERRGQGRLRLVTPTHLEFTPTEAQP